MADESSKEKPISYTPNPDQPQNPARRRFLKRIGRIGLGVAAAAATGKVAYELIDKEKPTQRESIKKLIEEKDRITLEINKWPSERPEVPQFRLEDTQQTFAFYEDGITIFESINYTDRRYIIGNNKVLKSKITLEPTPAAIAHTPTPEVTPNINSPTYNQGITTPTETPTMIITPTMVHHTPTPENTTPTPEDPNFIRDREMSDAEIDDLTKYIKESYEKYVKQGIKL